MYQRKLQGLSVPLEAEITQHKQKQKQREKQKQKRNQREKAQQLQQQEHHQSPSSSSSEDASASSETSSGSSSAASFSVHGSRVVPYLARSMPPPEEMNPTALALANAGCKVYCERRWPGCYNANYPLRHEISSPDIMAQFAAVPGVRVYVRQNVPYRFTALDKARMFNAILKKDIETLI